MKLSGFILALFYFISSIGYGLEVHYCLGEISDVNYALFDTHCACDELVEKPVKGCCEEKSFFVQLEEDHSAPALVDVSNTFLPLIAEFNWSPFNIEQDSSVKTYTFLDRGPPKSIDRVIEYHSLIIYS